LIVGDFYPSTLILHFRVKENLLPGRSGPRKRIFTPVNYEVFPFVTILTAAVDGTIRLMTKSPEGISRRRPKTGSGKPILVYFSSDERKIVDAAANAERRSISSFVANAALTAAERIIVKSSKK
jgi:hypothetical protein